jgi:hypothetical protein
MYIGIRWIVFGAVVLGVLALAGAPGASARPSLAPTPNTPIYGGIPGALPPGFVYSYNDRFRGWPVRPLSVQHPIRGSFLDPRGPDDDAMSGYHFGVDVNVDDLHPDPQAPAGLSHRVYALDSGVVSEPVANLKRHCGNRRLDAGHFSYWHVSPTVPPGARVRAGQQIGWTCLGVWHVHVSEWQIARGVRIWVNPIHRGGPFTPYTDTLPPRVDGLKFVTPSSKPWRPVKSLRELDSSTPVPADAVHGRVELRARIGDPQSFLGFLKDNPAWPSAWSPQWVSVAIVASSGRVVLTRTTFRADQMPQTPYLVHYAPGTIEDDNMQECVGPPQLRVCDGTYWYRPLSRFREEDWNTHTVRNGRYTVTVKAGDYAGNVGAGSLVVTVKN